MDILTPLDREDKKGFSIIELAVALFIFSLFLVFSLACFQKYHKSMMLELTAKDIVEAVSLAKEYALNERKNLFVVFTGNSFSILRENRELVGKEYRFRERIEVKEKSEGFNPVILQPDGTSKMAGFMVIRDVSGGKETRIVLHNLTGRCFIEK
ncbi:MAG TPA: prepilin-type N-terminal cleavage/methylation domain-containing protein [bacterium]|nr:prepilin-type N-terminal cleavage/methylation domain-containing protein [bacterium]